MNTRDELTSIRQRAADVARWREHFMPPLSKIDFSQRDIPRLLGALDAVLAPHQRQPATYGDDDAICMDCGEWWPCHTIQAVNDALEAGK